MGILAQSSVKMSQWSNRFQGSWLGLVLRPVPHNSLSKGLKEADREKIQSKYMNYEATYAEIEEVAKSLEQSADI